MPTRDCLPWYSEKGIKTAAKIFASMNVEERTGLEVNPNTCRDENMINCRTNWNTTHIKATNQKLYFLNQRKISPRNYA